MTPDAYTAADGHLRELDAKHFCAAGALLWHKKSGNPHALLAIEERTNNSRVEKRYNFLGGKRDSIHESPRHVAARECSEETGGQLSASARARIEQHAKPVVWVGQSKYAVAC